MPHARFGVQYVQQMNNNKKKIIKGFLYFFFGDLYILYIKKIKRKEKIKRGRKFFEN